MPTPPVLPRAVLLQAAPRAWLPGPSRTRPGGRQKQVRRQGWARDSAAGGSGPGLDRRWARAGLSWMQAGRTCVTSTASGAGARLLAPPCTRPTNPAEAPRASQWSVSDVMWPHVTHPGSPPSLPFALLSASRGLSASVQSDVTRLLLNLSLSLSRPIAPEAADELT